ncbi:MAG: lipopolysaccharide/colanic/teichoic acid biosynthesis glycosyltransferase [Planctomycetota bacterium]|jgi:lipopolysaccharide/colanic/teichoic acid biosynthesis glycosyltransferase
MRTINNRNQRRKHALAARKRMPVPILPRLIIDPELTRPQGGYALWGSRLFSLVAVCLGAPIALAASLLVACANLLVFRDPRKVLYTQSRMGYRGQAFKIYKFRTMYEAADCFGSWSGGVDQQRVTKLGRFLRSSHLDEIPQLWNVLRGDMNLIGPRPEMLEIHVWAEDEVHGFANRLDVRPGITGLAQVTQGYTGRSAEAYAEKLAIDERYIQQQSLRFDLSVACQTVVWMIRGKGWSWNQTQAPETAAALPEACDEPAQPNPREAA